MSISFALILLYSIVIYGLISSWHRHNDLYTVSYGNIFYKYVSEYKPFTVLNHFYNSSIDVPEILSDLDTYLDYLYSINSPLYKTAQKDRLFNKTIATYAISEILNSVTINIKAAEEFDVKLLPALIQQAISDVEEQYPAVALFMATGSYYTAQAVISGMSSQGLLQKYFENTLLENPIFADRPAILIDIDVAIASCY